MIGVLYVVHEAVHLQQGIGDEDTVGHLRQTGAESTLMQLDLAADHLGAHVVATRLDLPLAPLKDLQGRSLAAYPATAQHTVAARARKANRIVGLRFDHLARRLGVIPDRADEHIFADHGPAGGRIAILATGPPVRLLGTPSLSRDDAQALSAAADPGQPLTKLDAIVEQCLRALLPRDAA